MSTLFELSDQIEALLVELTSVEDEEKQEILLRVLLVNPRSRSEG